MSVRRTWLRRRRGSRWPSARRSAARWCCWRCSGAGALAWPLLVVAVGRRRDRVGQFSSLPAVTGPLLVWWLLPAVAAASLLLALVLGRSLVSYGLVLLAALELGAWVCCAATARSGR